MEQSNVAQRFTRYLCVDSNFECDLLISLKADSPSDFLGNAINNNNGVNYSPLFPAYLLQNKRPPTIPGQITSLAFYFSRLPYKTLGAMRPHLSEDERKSTYFTQGLASIVFVNIDVTRANQLLKHMDLQLMEYWPLTDSKLNPNKVKIINNHDLEPPEIAMNLESNFPKEIYVYIEQIYASIVTLRRSYAIYNPTELTTVDRILEITKELIEKYNYLTSNKIDTRDVFCDIHNSLPTIMKRNAVVSALAEISASLSYLVTQGTTGCTPILNNSSPFPHHSLLGVGGVIRALTKFTRYMESAFEIRDASSVVAKGYINSKSKVPENIHHYSSGGAYKLDDKDAEHFDQGGEFNQVNNTPLMVYLSQRHGFKETKFAITAASEILTSEVEPHWTIMTLSHEIMHNQVRQIFQELFGVQWDEDREDLISQEIFDEFEKCYKSEGQAADVHDKAILRYVILNYCCLMDRSFDIKTVRRTDKERGITRDHIEYCYRQYKPLAMELFVHFHDYYYAYAYQPSLYVMSLWASWIKVAAPYYRPLEYLTRTLATAACGTGKSPKEAFKYSREIFIDSLNMLAETGVKSPLYDKLINLLDEEKTYAHFKAAYYLIDQARYYFTSPKIAEHLDCIDQDPFSEGSAVAGEYTNSVYVYSEGGEKISPIRFSIASLSCSILKQLPLEDRQLLAGWNTMVLSSREVT